MLDYLITNACIITMDAAHTLYRRGYLGVRGNSIAVLGEMGQGELPAARKVIDFHGNALLPGLIDAHGHAGHCLTKNLGEYRDDWEEMAEAIYYRYTDDFFWYAEGALAAAERLKFGITTGVSMLGSTPRVDSIEPLAAHFQGSIKTGIRQMSGIGCVYGKVPKRARRWVGEQYEEYEVAAETAYRTTREALEAFNGKHPRQTCIVAPGRMGRRPDESDEANIRHNREMHRLAVEFDVPLHTHAFAGDVQFLYDHTPEVLTPRLSLTHSTGYSQAELEILQRTGAYVFHGPSTYSVIMNWCPAFEMIEQGIGVVIVPDGTAPDRSFDLWREMKRFQSIHRIHHRDPLLAPCGMVLEKVTIEAARALGIADRVGSLEVGKRADLIGINVHQPHLAPFGDMPIQRLVYHAMGQDVEFVMVDGQIAMRGRSLTQCDEAQILADAEAAYAQMMRRLNRYDLTENEHLFDMRQCHPAGAAARGFDE